MIKKILLLIILFFLNLFIFPLNVNSAETTTNLVLLEGPTSTPTLVPTSSPTSSSSSTSSDGGWRAPDCTATKPGSAPIITNIVSGENSATLTWTKAKDPVTKYLIAYGTKSGSIEYGNPNVGDANTTSYTVKGLSGGTKYYFRIKAINDCMPGDFSNEVSNTPSGQVITTAIGETSVLAEGFVPASEIPSQLFDIALIVDETEITSASDLLARVTFISFGRENTPVEMTFTIIDENGKEYYRSVDNTTIQTEGIFNKSFSDLILAKGKYTLILNTLYNNNIRDEFKQGFEVVEATNVSKSNFLSNTNLLILVGAGIIAVAIILIVRLVRKKE